MSKACLIRPDESRRQAVQPEGRSGPGMRLSNRVTKVCKAGPKSLSELPATAIAAHWLDRSGVNLRPGEVIEYVTTQAGSNSADDRVRA